jgi:hypothetical protein
MTKYVLLLIFFLVHIGLKAQTQSGIDIRKIALISPADTSKGVLPGDSSAQCIAVLGEPDNISDYYSEIDEDTMKLYKYGKSEIFFLKDKLVSWFVSDKKIYVGQVNGKIFKIGDKLAPARQRGARQKFMDFPITHYKNVSRNIYFQSASVMELMDNNVYTDSRIELLFNASNTLFSISISD